MYHIATQVQWSYNTFQLAIHSRSWSQKHIMDGDVWDLENQFHPKSSVVKIWSQNVTICHAVAWIYNLVLNGWSFRWREWFFSIHIGLNGILS